MSGDFLAELDKAVAEAPLEALPDLVGRLARLQAVATLRLQITRQAAVRPLEAVVGGPDRSLSVDEVAERLGRATSWVYRHGPELPFRFTLPGGRFGYSEAGLNRYMRRRSS
jgi:hypothetical protein